MANTGICECGCGKQTTLRRDSDARKGYVKGTFHRFLQGHGRRTRVTVEEAQPFKIDGAYCRVIPLTKGMYAIVDEADYEQLARFKWNARWSKFTCSYYAMRKGPAADGKQTSILMHREILGLKRGDPREGDHIHSGHTWDNRRNNLRISDGNGNAENRRRPRNNTSGFKGVTFVQSRGRYNANIGFNGKMKKLGYFKDPQAGAAAYLNAAQRLYGEFANPGLEMING